MSPVAYRLIHVLSMMLLFTALGGLLFASRSGAPAGASRKTAVISHGLALLLLLVSGFGALAKLGFAWPWPTWVWLKLVIWLVFGGVVVIIRRVPRFSPALWWLLPLLGGLAGYLALYKP